MKKFYIIQGTRAMATTAFRKLNFRLNEDGSIRGMYFSSNPKAIPGGTIYFKSKRKAKKYLYLCYGYDYDNPVITESKLTSRDLYKQVSKKSQLSSVVDMNCFIFLDFLYNF